MENIQELKKIIEEKDACISEMASQIAELKALVNHYEEKQRVALMEQFGKSSEKGVTSGHIDQLDLFNEAEVTADPTVPEPELEQITYTRRKPKGKREADLSDLPVEKVEYTLPAEERICPECGGELHVMGHDTARRELEIIPAQVRLVEHIQEVYACRHCEHNSDHVPIIKAPVPEPVIKGSLASPSAVAHTMTQKYMMHAPLHRQEQEWQRQGIPLSRQTMANWVIRCSEDWLYPLYTKLHMLLLEEELLLADETTCQVLHEPGKPATSTSYMWLYRSVGAAKKRIVIYEYQPGRSRIYPQRFLGNWKGYLHTDGYAAYDDLSDLITIVRCWVHMRRYWVKALNAIPKNAREDSVPQKALKTIGYLFHLEGLWKDKTPDERHHLRLEQSKPLAEEFFSWVASIKALPQSFLGSAVSYTLEQKKGLMNVYLDGRTEFSTNLVENSARPFVLSRKNFLFMNTVSGAKASAVVLSLIETAKANGLIPFQYLKFLFETLPNTTSSALDSLLPWGSAVPEHCKVPVKEKAAHA